MFLCIFIYLGYESVLIIITFFVLQTYLVR